MNQLLQSHAQWKRTTRQCDWLITNNENLYILCQFSEDTDAVGDEIEEYDMMHVTDEQFDQEK